VLAGAETVSAQVRRTNDARSSQTRTAVTQDATSEDDAWHATFDPIVTNLISLDDQIRSMEVRLNDIGRMTDRSAQLLEVRNFERAVLEKEADALRVGLDLISKADTFLPTADRTNETREKTVLVIETKLLLIITRVVQIKSTIIIIKESRVPPFIPPVPVATTTAPAGNQRR
jgi:hypothetical protein